MFKYSRRSASSLLIALPFIGGGGLVRLVAEAEPAPQAGWRFCGKCNELFFDGSPNKGRCPAGGGHQASGLNFILPHDGPATKTAQRDWRFCGQCNAMFFDGSPNKGVCPSGGGHRAVGFNFVLPHDVPATSKSQAAWRFCSKCNAMFFDGSPAKGRCPAGVGHTPVGFTFVLPNAGDPFANALETFWRDAGRGIVADVIKRSLVGRRFAKGVSGRDANVNLGDIQATWQRTSPTSLQVEMTAPGNNADVKVTQPSFLGSFADPSFRVGFALLGRFDLRARAGAPFVEVNVVDLSVSRASVHGSNVSGTLVETFADAFSGGGFSRQITSQVNDDSKIKGQVQSGLNQALAGIPSIGIP